MRHNPIKSSLESRVQRWMDRAGLDSVLETAGYSDKPVSVDTLGGTATHPGTKETIAELKNALLAKAQEADHFVAHSTRGANGAGLRFTLHREDGETIAVGRFDDARGTDPHRALQLIERGHSLGFEVRPNGQVTTSESASAADGYHKRIESLKPDGRTEGRVVHPWDGAFETSYYTKYPPKND